MDNPENNNNEEKNDVSNQKEIKEEEEEEEEEGKIEKVENENNFDNEIPENPIQNIHNLNEKEIEDRISKDNFQSIQTEKILIPNSQYKSNNNLIPNNIMSTGVFMQNIDLRCDDHINKFNLDIQATRFCSKCKMLCCDTCVIDFHNDHINFAKIKIEEYFKNAKLKIENLQSKVNNSIRFKLNNQEIDNIINNQNKILDIYFNGRKNKFEDLKKKIDIIIQNDNEIYEKLKEKISIFYKDECFIRMNQPLKENENLLTKIKIFLQEWNNLSKSDKVQIIKSKKIEDFENENLQNEEMIKKSIEAFKGKSINIKNKIIEIIQDLNEGDKFLEFDKIIFDIQKKILDSREKINTLKYDNLVIEKVNNIVNQNILLNKKEYIYSNRSNNNNDNNMFKKDNILNNYNDNNFSLLNDNKIKQIDIDNYQLFIYLQLKSNILLIFNPKTGFQNIKVTKNHFQNPLDSFINFPENSKYINLGSSILLTGGYINKEKTNNCYLMIISEIPSKKEYELSIISYAKMLSARERHNIIYLPDKKVVLVCSGFFNKESEYSELNNNEWNNLGEMNEVRGNATISYINNRYIYVIGGYKILDNKKGQYLNNLEYLDFNNLNNGWKQIEFGNLNIQLSAMGVIPINNNQFILCGGFDGKEYKRDVYKVDCSNCNNVIVEKTNFILPAGYIFLHNTFAKMENNFYNIELTGNVIKFNVDTYKFEVNQFNK